MQASHTQGDLGASSPGAAQAEGVPARPGEVKLFVHKPGWRQEVGSAIVLLDNWFVCVEPDFTYFRVEFRDFRLSHASTLFLLQGASLKTLFSDVVVKVGDRDPEVYSLAVSESPRLTVPPPSIRRVVLAHIFERNATDTPEALFEKIFFKEMARSSF